MAMSIWHKHLQQPRVSLEGSGAWQRPSTVTAPAVPRYADGMSGSYLGPRFSEVEIQAAIDRGGWVARKVDRTSIARQVAAALADEKVVGLLQGRMEFGPRALGGQVGRAHV